MNINAIGAAAAAGLTLVLLPAEASAQAWIGQVVGNQIAAQQAAAAEAACRGGAPAPEPVIANARVKTGELMTAYFALTGASRPRDIQKIFGRRPDGRWSDAGGVVPVLQLGERLDAPTPVLTPVSFVVAGDSGSARGVWSAADAEGAVVGYYAVDFRGTPGFWSGVNWQVWNMTVFPADQEPDAPGAYCHYDPDQAWRL